MFKISYPYEDCTIIVFSFNPLHFQYPFKRCFIFTFWHSQILSDIANENTAIWCRQCKEYNILYLKEAYIAKYLQIHLAYHI